jgi:glycosyltransferase involved in cell wall biosynthesis
MEELISIVIPTFNRKETLQVVLPSLAGQACSPESYEIIIADSGSTDGTAEYIQSLGDARVRFFTMENRGRSGARNRGIKEARGELVLFTDADIIADEHLLESHRKLYQMIPGSAVVGCEVQVASLEEYERVRRDRKNWRTLHPTTRKKLSWLYFLTGNALVPRARLIEAGMFDENFTGYGHEDLELGYRLQRIGVPIHYNPQAINYHWHPVEFDEQCQKMKLAGISTVRFYNKHGDPMIRLRLGMTPLSLGIHSLISPEGWFLKWCAAHKESMHVCREIVLQYHYLCGIKEALGKGLPGSQEKESKT